MEETAGNGSGEDGKARTAISVVRVRVWLEALRRSAGVERLGEDGRLVYERVSTAYVKALGTDGPEGKADPKFYRYADGKSSPNKNTVERVDAVWPGTLDAYRIGPFEGDEPVRLWEVFSKPSTDLWDIVCDAFPNMVHSLLDGRPHYARIGMMEAAVAELGDESDGDGKASRMLRLYSNAHLPSLKVLAGILAFWRLSVLVYDDVDGRIYGMVNFAVNELFSVALKQWDAHPFLWDAITELHEQEKAKFGELIAKYRPDVSGAAE